MFQLLPEVKDVFNSLFNGIKRYDEEPSGSKKWDELSSKIKRVDNEAVKIKDRIVKTTPHFLKEPIRDALYLKKNDDRTFSGYTGTILGGGSPEGCFDILFTLDVLDVSVLLIDDILDNAERRANKPAHHSKWGMDTTLSVAMYLGSLSLKMVMESSVDEKTQLRILKEMNDFHTRIYEGQFLDVGYQSKDIEEITEKHYLNMIALTTGYQMAGCFRIGGILTNLDENTISNLGEIGLRFGMAGQIRDDLIDYILDEEYTWKTPLLDFRRDKKRIPLIIAWKNASEDEKDKIRRLQNKSHIEEQDYIKILSLVMKPENLSEIKLVIKRLENETMEFAKRGSLNSEGIEMLKMLFSLVDGN